MNLEPRAQPLDLRSRKRIAAIRHIQRVALDLFDEHGYDSVTIADIARAADVGERSIYRYFGSKPMLVFYDEIDQQAIDVFADRIRHQELLAAVAATLDDLEPMLTDEVMSDSLRRLRLVQQHRELEAALADYAVQLGDAFGVVIARARQQADDDLVARVHGRCIISALTAAILAWNKAPVRRPLIDNLRDAMDALAGLGTKTPARESEVGNHATTPSVVHSKHCDPSER
jgi:AcrR family transcriptional regulator